MPYLPRDRFADAYAEILNASLSGAWAGPSTSSRSTASVLLLVAVEDLSYAEAAKVLGVPLGTVMSRLSRARERMRSFLDTGRTGLLRRVK